MPNGVPRVALWALLVLVLAATLAPLQGVRAAGPSNYALSGVVTTTGGVRVPGGVTVDLISGATHQVFPTTTSSGGTFNFTNPGTSGALVPGWWGLYVPPQANLTIPSAGCRPCGILPENSTPIYHYETAQNLSNPSLNTHTLTGVNVLSYTSKLYGNATSGSGPASGANVELLAPGFDGFVLSNNTTLAAGNFSMKVPMGTWVLETIFPGVPTQYSYQQITINKAHQNTNITVSPYLTYGNIYQSAAPTSHVTTGGNATLFDPFTGYVYSTASTAGFYDVGTYPHAFTSGSQTFDLVLQTIGYQTMWYPLTVSSGSPTGGPNPHNVWAPAQYAPSVYQTTLSYSPGFKWLNTSTVAALSNDSTFPELPNASVGNLWAQLALDWQHNLTFDSANMGTVLAWIQSAGPFFPAGAAQAKVNSSGYNESANGTFSSSGGCTTGFCDLGSSAGLSYNWSKNYQLNGSAPVNASTYTVSFNFRHPTNYQAINYSIVLPKGYALQANTAAPAGSKLVAGGVGGTWTKFTLVSRPYSSPTGTATFTFVKYGKVTANVSASVSQFTFSKLNVLNATHGNYTVIVGQGQNVSFSAAGSTFPAGVNGSKYTWNWGDHTAATTSSQATSYHTFSATGESNGSMNVTSSGGTTANVSFHVWVGNGAISGNITSNASASMVHKTPNGTTYLMVNSSTPLYFNATGFTSTLFAGGPKAPLSVAYWNATDGPVNKTTNFSASAASSSSASYVPDNFTVIFSPTGDNQYLTTANVGGTAVPFLGWQFNITVKVWNAVGSYATQTLIVLVQDKEKPTAVATVQNSLGKNVTSSGLVEGANHMVVVKLVGGYSTDPNGGSLVKYFWNVTNVNSSANQNITQVNRSGLRAPLAFALNLTPQVKPYTVNLTVTDRAGNVGYNVASITVAVNTSTRPVLAVGNLTAPSTMTDGTSYTVWVNVTNTLGQNSTALGVQVAFYLLPSSGSGTPIHIGGSPGSVTFYTYDNSTGAVNGTLGHGSVSLKYNQTVRAQISFDPNPTTGTWQLWANATATNEFAGDYATGGNQAHVTVTLNPNPIILYEEIGAGIAIVAAVVLGIVYWRYWRPRRASAKPTSSKSGLEKGSAKKDDEDDDE